MLLKVLATSIPSPVITAETMPTLPRAYQLGALLLRFDGSRLSRREELRGLHEK